MSWYSRNPPDLATFGDLDAVLSKIGDITVREPVRQYYRILFYVQRIRSAKWCLFALFITMFIELEVRVLFPTSVQTQALVALLISILVFGILWSCEYLVIDYGGDPAELFETRDEELAIAQELSIIARNALPLSAPHSSLKSNANLGALFVVPENETSAVAAAAATTTSKSERAPLVSINKAAPRSPIALNTLPRVYRTASDMGGGKGEARQLRTGLLNFNASLKRQ